jgi:hypothetical protein
MKIVDVTPNNRRKDFSISAGKQHFTFPYAKCIPTPSATNPVSSVFVDEELGSDAFTYILKDKSEGSVHIDHILEYNKDPKTLLELFVYRLTLDVKKRLESSIVPKRRVARELQTSPSQLYRLLDVDRSDKSLQQIFSILLLLDCEVDLVIKKGHEKEVIEMTTQSVRRGNRRLATSSA